MGNGQKEVRLLLADEQSLFRETVRVVLEAQPDFAVVGEAADGAEAVAETVRTRPDVVLLDARLPLLDGVETARTIKEKLPSCRILVLTSEEDQEDLLDALEAGADGYLSKESPIAELIAATRSVHQGETLIPPRMLGGLLAQLIRRQREENDALQRLARLTRREREVLKLLAEGADNEGIARALVISRQTARTHVQNILTKLGVHSRLEAAAFVQYGLFDEPVDVIQ